MAGFGPILDTPPFMRTEGCTAVNTGGNTFYGRSPYTCFTCSNGKCTQTRRPVVEGKRNEAGATVKFGHDSSASHMTSSKPTTINNPGTIKTRGGKH